jgi:hypothetical protein
MKIEELQRRFKLSMGKNDTIGSTAKERSFTSTILNSGTTLMRRVSPNPSDSLAKNSN